jgi:DNA modification methylase
MIDLQHGDCLDLMENIPDKSIDMILCDPPYGKISCKWDTIIPFEELWGQYKRIIKDHGCIALFGSEPFSSRLRMSNIKMYKYDWIWHKNMTSGFALAKKQPMRNHEIISIFYQKQCKYFPIKEKRDLNKNSAKRMDYSFNTEKGVNKQQNGIKKIKFVPEDKFLSYPKTIKKFNCVSTSSRDRKHPTQKPVEILKYFIRTYTLEGEVVLDNCMGSGSTGVACVNLDRNFIGMEKEKKYFNIAQKRINDAIQNKKERLF